MDDWPSIVRGRPCASVSGIITYARAQVGGGSGAGGPALLASEQAMTLVIVRVASAWISTSVRGSPETVRDLPRRSASATSASTWCDAILMERLDRLAWGSPMRMARAQAYGTGRCQPDRRS